MHVRGAVGVRSDEGAREGERALRLSVLHRLLAPRGNGNSTTSGERGAVVVYEQSIADVE